MFDVRDVLNYGAIACNGINQKTLEFFCETEEKYQLVIDNIENIANNFDFDYLEVYVKKEKKLTINLWEFRY